MKRFHVISCDFHLPRGRESGSTGILGLEALLGTCEGGEEGHERDHHGSRQHLLPVFKPFEVENGAPGPTFSSISMNLSENDSYARHKPLRIRSSRCMKYMPIAIAAFRGVALVQERVPK